MPFLSDSLVVDVDENAAWIKPDRDISHINGIFPTYKENHNLTFVIPDRPNASLRSHLQGFVLSCHLKSIQIISAQSH